MRVMLYEAAQESDTFEEMVLVQCLGAMQIARRRDEEGDGGLGIYHTGLSRSGRARLGAHLRLTDSRSARISLRKKLPAPTS